MRFPQTVDIKSKRLYFHGLFLFRESLTDFHSERGKDPLGQREKTFAAGQPKDLRTFCTPALKPYAMRTHGGQNSCRLCEIIMGSLSAISGACANLNHDRPNLRNTGE